MISYHNFILQDVITRRYHNLQQFITNYSKLLQLIAIYFNLCFSILFHFIPIEFSKSIKRLEHLSESSKKKVEW